MEAILLPTDFSPTAHNAALYALQLAEQMGIGRLVLYHSYEIPVSIDPISPGVQMLDLESVKTSSAEALEVFARGLQAYSGSIQIEHINEYGALSDGLDEVCARAHASIVVMGIAGGGVLEEKLVGSTTISVGKHTHKPVVIVPAKAPFAPIRSIMLASDFEKNDDNIPADEIKNLIGRTGARLFVLHIEDKEPESTPSQIRSGDFAIHAAIDALQPSYHTVHSKHFAEAVNDFVIEHQVDLVISIPKEKGFFQGWFSESHTKMLAFHSTVPVMVMHK